MTKRYNVKKRNKEYKTKKNLITSIDQVPGISPNNKRIIKE